VNIFLNSATSSTKNWRKTEKINASAISAKNAYHCLPP